MQIRTAQAADIAQIQQYDRHIPPHRLKACIADGLVLALYDEDRVLGVLRHSLFWQTIPFMELLYIDEAIRGQGWGSKMTISWEMAMKAMGYTYGMLSTQEDETAKFFYEKLGYRRIGAFLPSEQEADELIYGKELQK